MVNILLRKDNEVMAYTKRLGTEIRKIRIHRHLTQEDLADKIGLNATHLGHIEQGLKEPRIKTLIKIADGLDVRVKDLIPF